mgnify:CR=1 FL=1
MAGPIPRPNLPTIFAPHATAMQWKKHAAFPNSAPFVQLIDTPTPLVIPSAFCFRQPYRFSATSNAWVFVEMEPLHYKLVLATDGVPPPPMFKCRISVLDRTDRLVERPRNVTDAMNQLFHNDGCAVAFVQSQRPDQLVPDVIIRMPPATQDQDFLFGIRDGKWQIGFDERSMSDVIAYHRWPNHWQRAGAAGVDRVIVDNGALMRQMVVAEPLALLLLDEFYPLPHAITLQDVWSQIKWHLDPAASSEFLWMAQLSGGRLRGLAIGYYLPANENWCDHMLFIKGGQLYGAGGGVLVLTRDELVGTPEEVVRRVAAALGREEPETRKRSATSRWAIEEEQTEFGRRQSRPPRKIYDPDTVHHTKKKKRAMASQKHQK